MSGVTIFPRVLRTLKTLHPRQNYRRRPHVLVPGARVGRLAHDIADLGGARAGIFQRKMSVD